MKTIVAATQHLLKHKSEKIIYDNSSSGLAAINIQEAIDEVALAASTIKPFTTITDPVTDAIDQAMVDAKGGVVITLTTTGNNQNLPAPTDTGIYHKFIIINNDTSTDSIDIIGASTKTLQIGEQIAFIWDGTEWIPSKTDNIWIDDGTDVKIKNSNINVDLQNGGLKDTNVIVAVKLGDGSNTSLTTSNKTLLGGINELKVDLDGFPDGLKVLTAAEITQLTNIDSSTISVAQWGYIGALNQGLSTTSSPTFNAATITNSGLTTLDITSTGSSVVASMTRFNQSYLAIIALSGEWQVGLRSGDANLHFYDDSNSVDRMVIQQDGLVTIPGSLTTATINAFSLGGKLTAGASEIEGSNFDITGGTISGISSLGVDNLVLDGGEVLATGSALTLTSDTGNININPDTGFSVVLDGTVNIDGGEITGVGDLTASGIITGAAITGGNVTNGLNPGHKHSTLTSGDETPVIGIDLTNDGQIHMGELRAASSNGVTYFSRSTKAVTLNPNWGSGDVESRFTADAGMNFWLGIGTNYDIIRMDSGGEVLMPDVYSDTVSTSPKLLSIQSDGQLGESIIATPTFASLDVDNINIDGNIISSTDTNGNMVLIPDGTGAVYIGSSDPVTSGPVGLLNFTQLGSNVVPIIHFSEVQGNKFTLGYSGVSSGSNDYTYMETSDSSSHTFRIYGDGRIWMLDVYNDTVSTSPKLLSIQSGGMLGESTNATPTFASLIVDNDYTLGGRQINTPVTISIVSNNLDVSDNKSVYRITSTESSPDQVDTISAGTDGQIIYIMNETSGQVSVRNEEAPGANNNIFISGGSKILNQNDGFLMLIYNSNIDTNGAWVAVI